MNYKLLSASAFAIYISAAHAQAPLPPKMEGRWQDTVKGHSNSVMVELVRMESPTEAIIKVAWWPYCPWGETKAVFKDDAWRFSPQTCTKYSYNAKVRPVEGKNRLEGTYGSSEHKMVYFEWE